MSWASRLAAPQPAPPLAAAVLPGSGGSGRAAPPLRGALCSGESGGCAENAFFCDRIAARACHPDGVESVAVCSIRT